MKRRTFVRNTTLASMALTLGGCLNKSDLESILQEAGNLEDHGERYRILIGLKGSSLVDPQYLPDLEVVLGYARTWGHNNRSAQEITDERLRLSYLSRPYTDLIREGILTAGQTSEVKAGSPFYPLYALYAGLCLMYHTIQISDIRLVPERRDLWYGKARELISLAGESYPGNRTLDIYFNKPVPWPDAFTYSGSEPGWARNQREMIFKLQEIIHWWIDHRQLPDGTYGGGLNDDCEMWRWWQAVLLGFDDPRSRKAQEMLSRVTLDRPELELGYTSRLTDVEHSSEETSDVITPMMQLFPDRAEWSDRVRKIFRLASSFWSGTNQRGFTQFKTSYLSSMDMDMSPHRTCDTIYHFRVMQPVLLYWQRTGDREIGAWALRWMDTWRDAAMSTARGKPAGIVPTSIYWPSGMPGGQGEQWWKPGNYSSPIYDWPHRLDIIYSTLVLAYHMSGKEHYLDPLLLSARRRMEYLDKYGSEERDWEPGSEEWCLSQLGEVVGPALLKYRTLTGNPQFDLLLEKDAGGYANLLLTGQTGAFEAELDTLSEAFRQNRAVYTSEVRNTDRVLAFPDYYLNFFYEAASSRQLAALLYKSVTGDAGYQGYFPINAVRWEVAPGEIAAVITTNQPDRLEMRLYNFSKRTVIPFRALMLGPGPYTLEVTPVGVTTREKKEIILDGQTNRVEIPATGIKEVYVILAGN